MGKGHCSSPSHQECLLLLEILSYNLTIVFITNIVYEWQLVHRKQVCSYVGALISKERGPNKKGWHLLTLSCRPKFRCAKQW